MGYQFAVSGWISYHAAEVGDSGILVGIGVKQHLRVGMDGYVRFHVFLVLAQELGHRLDFGFRLWEGTAVGVIARVGGGTLLWDRREEEKHVEQQIVAVICIEKSWFHFNQIFKLEIKKVLGTIVDISKT